MVPGVFERRTCPVGKPTGTCSTLGLSLTLEDSTRNSVCLPSRTATVRPFRTAPPPLRFPAPTALQDLRSLLPGLSIPNAAPNPTEVVFHLLRLSRPASSRASKPASFHLRRFPRPWRFSPPRPLWCVSTTHTHGVVVPLPWRLPDPKTCALRDGPETWVSRPITY